MTPLLPTPPDSAPFVTSATDPSSAKELSPDTNPPQDSHPLGDVASVLITIVDVSCTIFLSATELKFRADYDLTPCGVVVVGLLVCFKKRITFQRFEISA